MMLAAEVGITRRLADYKKVSGVAWIVLGIIQTLSIVFAVAGLWNICVGVKHLKSVKLIIDCDPAVSEAHKGVAGIAIAGLINLIFGAVVGVALVCFDFYIRDQILKHRQLFPGDENLTLHNSKITALEQLGRLREQGILDEAEFVREKRLITGN